MPDVFELEVRPADDVDTGWLGEDAIEIGPPPRPWAWTPPNLLARLPRVPIAAVLGIIVVALAVAVGISAGHPTRPLAAPTPEPSSVTQESPTELAIAAMVSAAQSPVELSDYAIENNARPNCPPSPVNSDPVKVIAAMVQQYEPDFTLRDSSRGIELSGTCSVQLRLLDHQGTTIIVTVLPPPNDITPYIALKNDDILSAMDVVASVDGWQVEVGVVGSPGSLPSLMEVNSIATDARVHW